MFLHKSCSSYSHKIKSVTKHKKQAVGTAVDLGRELEIILKQRLVPNFWKSQADEINCVVSRLP